MNQNVPTIIFVCTTCRSAGEAFEPETGRSGFKFYEALKHAIDADKRFKIQPVECLSSCDKSCNVTFAAKNKWSYGFSGLDALSQTQDVIDVAKLHYETPDGVIPWFERPESIRTKSTSRTPPLPT